ISHSAVTWLKWPVTVDAYTASFRSAVLMAAPMPNAAFSLRTVGPAGSSGFPSSGTGSLPLSAQLPSSVAASSVLHQRKYLKGVFMTNTFFIVLVIAFVLRERAHEVDLRLRDRQADHVRRHGIDGYVAGVGSHLVIRIDPFDQHAQP